MTALHLALALRLPGLSKAKVPGIAALVLLLATASPVHAAAPTTGSTPPSTVGTTPSIAASPPTVSNFRADGGAAVTWDKDVALTWTQQGQPKEWRVSSQGGGFAHAQWMPLPYTQPYKVVLGVNPSDGPYTIQMQLRNEHGESAIASTSIEYRQAPKITAYSTITRAGPFETQFDVRLTFQGKLTRWALTATSSPPGASGAWQSHAQAIASPATAMLDLKSGSYASAFNGKLVSGSTVTTWLHAQRDDGPIDSRQLDFVYTGPERSFHLDLQQTRAFVQRLGERNRIGAQLLTAAGKCEVFASSGGGYIGAQVAQGFYVVGSTPIVKPMRCRFNLFDSKPLAPGWTLLADSVQLARNKCGIVTRTGGSSPNVALEVELGVFLGTAAHPLHEGCHLEGLTLKGPWSDVTQPYLLAIP